MPSLFKIDLTSDDQEFQNIFIEKNWLDDL